MFHEFFFCNAFVVPNVFRLGTVQCRVTLRAYEPDRFGMLPPLSQGTWSSGVLSESLSDGGHGVQEQNPGDELSSGRRWLPWLRAGGDELMDGQ
jgi:hypothetical protein